jgi:hypothetical protein
VIEAVVADEMAVPRHAPGNFRLGLDPASLEEPRRDDVALGEDVENPLADPGPVRPIGVFRVKGQGDPEFSDHVRHGAYFSTPLITIPRVRKRWKTRKITIGMTIVIRVPAWMNAWLR